jgi:hypothetical protein
MVPLKMFDVDCPDDEKYGIGLMRIERLPVDTKNQVVIENIKTNFFK